jgi:CheY-like chemotaxis protein
VVLRNIQLETRLIDDLLDFHRIIKGNLNFAAVPVDVHAMIRNVVAICQSELEQRIHELQMALAAEQYIVAGDPARLQQVLWNVLKNAIKFTHPGGVIAVTTAVEHADTLLITVTDNGRGIEAEMLGSIFSAFEQGSVQGMTQFGGLGLGLAIVKTFVLKHGGTVEAASRGRDQGATFSIRLPLAAALSLNISELPLIAGSAARPHAAVTGRILLVDDHTDTLWSMKRLLSRCGYEVLTAGSCAEALRHACQHGPDVIISDIGLPDGSGLELLRELRRHTTAPAIALSGYGMEADVAQTREAGFTTHLTKPVDFPHLLEVVQRLIKAP